ncbi:unnamed protein product [Paramecium sonneborni]|uniref:RanBP2-type domain-containing protein n=1 Tax=Paramecium sonneborni TaxID=65129 RepID=A0A8S1KMP8_9CILI|nr:unnamed protein product [Paramecium sonneborni]
MYQLEAYSYIWKCMVCEHINDYFIKKCPQCQTLKECFCCQMNTNYELNHIEQFNNIGVIEIECNQVRERQEIIKLKISKIRISDIEGNKNFQKQFMIKPITNPPTQNSLLSSNTQEQTHLGVPFEKTFSYLDDLDLIVFENRIKAQIYLNQCIQLNIQCPIKKYIELKTVFPQQKQLLNLNEMLKSLKITQQSQQFALASVVIELLKRSYTFQSQMLQSLQFPIPEEESRIQGFHNLIILNFQTTCFQDYQLNFNPEIIQFSAQFYDINLRKITQSFQTLVKPSQNSTISEYCTKQTGIKQSQINAGIQLQQAINQFLDLLRDLGRICIITQGDFDLNHLKKEAERKRIKLAKYFTYYINLKKVFPKSLRINNYLKDPSLIEMLECCGLSFTNQIQNGIVNLKNATLIVDHLICQENFQFDERMITYTYKN